MLSIRKGHVQRLGDEMYVRTAVVAHFPEIVIGQHLKHLCDDRPLTPWSAGIN